MASLEIRQFRCLSDNYGVIIHDPSAGVAAAIDTPDEDAVRTELTRAGLKLTHIFTTHHHGDHVAGHAGLKRETGCKIYGPAKDRGQIPGMDVEVKEGDVLPFGNFELHVIETPGHTLGHVSFYIPHAEQTAIFGEKSGVAFVGDTLFSVGCGRVIEGQHNAMWASLQKLMALPKDTLIYCGHEYTAGNVAFALAVNPENEALQQRKIEVDLATRDGKPTLPITLARELETNPFLRVNDANIRAHLGLGDSAPAAQVFETLRRRKDNF